MVHMLPHLDNSAPGVRGELFFAIVALSVCFNKLSNESLLYFSLVV